MTDKITLTNLVNLTNQTTAVNAINANNAVLVTAIDNTLSRDGTSPNQMGATLDMNSHNLINLPSPATQNEPIRLADMTNYLQFQNSVNLASALATANTSATNAAASASQAATSAASIYPLVSILSYIPSNQYTAIKAGTSTFDCGPAFNTALAALNGQTLYVPAGTYPIYTPIVYVGPTTSVIVPGAKIQGDSSSTAILVSHINGIQCTNAFSTTSGSSLVNVNVPNHGLVTNQPVVFTFLNSNNIGGLDFDGPWRVAGVIDANNIQIYHYSAATSTVTASGNCYVSVPMMTLASGSSHFQEGTTLTGLQLQGAYNTKKGTAALRFSGQLHLKLDDIWINGTDDGIQCYAATGDVPIVGNTIDSSTHIYFERARIENCSRWGVEMVGCSENVGGTLYGHNEISNVVLNQVLINACGFGNNSLKYSGGMKWKGQGVHFAEAAFTVCQNCSLFTGLPYAAAGLPSAVTFDFLVLENTQGAGSTAWYAQGVDTITGKILEIYQNNTYTAALGLYLDATVQVTQNVNILSSIVRVSSGNTPYTAFTFNGGANNNSTIRIYTPSFQLFGAGGQTQVTGFTFKT